MTTGAVPNDVLRAWRISQRWSQDELARQLRAAGDEIGEPNDASKRTVQRWESGATRSCRYVYARALEVVTGLPAEALGFNQAVPDGRGGHDVVRGDENTAPDAAVRTLPGQYSGVWLSKYEYYSSGREATFTGLHYVVVLQRNGHLTVRSLPGASSTPDSSLTMNLEVDRNIVSGTWTEQTSPAGYYKGATYHGCLQLLVEPTGRRMSGKWVGFGRGMQVNTGPWDLTFIDVSTSQATLDAYSRPPEE